MKLNSKKNIKNDFNYFFKAFKRLYKSILGIHEGTNPQATIDGIKKDIGFRGHSAWILFFSILIASIGLNINSTAVIIGAMLISPLMGPILGVGLAVGTNDSSTLIRSLKNLGIAIFISLFTSTLYFALTPLDIEQTELLARTRPTLLDVLIALFGGFAGIIAGSRKEKSNVIPGVAIATALMPPLCTAGYAMAHLKWSYFFGAFYLFFINSVFISLSTFIVVKRLKFPVMEYVDKQKLKHYKLILVFFLLVTIIPSGVIFYYVVQETRFKVAAEKFIDNECDFEDSKLLSYKLAYDDSLSTIDLYFIGENITQQKHVMLEDKLSKYRLNKESWASITKSTKINIYQESKDADVSLEERLSEFDNNLRIEILEDIYKKNEEVIKSKDGKIDFLEKEILKLHKKDTVPYKQLAKEMLFHFPEIEKYSFANSIQIATNNGDSILYDTIPVFLIKFNELYKPKHKKEQQDLTKINQWLKVRLDNEQIQTITY